jgi:hypothetical protein
MESVRTLDELQYKMSEYQQVVSLNKVSGPYENAASVSLRDVGMAQTCIDMVRIAAFMQYMTDFG